MTTSMISARESRKSAQPFDVDLFRNKLKNWERKQITETWEMINTRKRKLNERYTEMDKEEAELSEDYRDDLVYQFGKRQRGDSYYPIDDDELEVEDVSPFALPSPVTVYNPTSATPFQSHVQSGSYFDTQHHASTVVPETMSMAMRRQMSGYSEVSTQVECDDSWMSPCPPMSRSSISSSISSSMPDTPTNDAFGAADDDDNDNECSEASMTDIEHSDALHLAHSISHDPLDLDLASMAPHERNLLAALAPERFEKAALIRRAFRQSEKLLDQLKREARGGEVPAQVDMDMDDGEYDQVFGELMHV